MEFKQAVISPGSRNAPLTIAFNRHPQIKCYSISDERSAAFTALGMAQAGQKIVALICTSGSAALNYAPAIAEAYFQQVPILIITADRPREWIDQWDGQTIRQQNIYGKHVKAAYNLPLLSGHKDELWQTYRMVNEALLVANGRSAGPVHINIPFREPFYPKASDAYQTDKPLKFIGSAATVSSLAEQELTQLSQQFEQAERPALLMGQANYSERFIKQIDHFSQQLNLPIFADVISNGHMLTNAIRATDSAAMNLKDAAYQPDLLISFGRSIISKNIKLFLRNAHFDQWHVHEGGEYLSDPFQNLSKIFDTAPERFLEQTKEVFGKKDSSYLEIWRSKSDTVEQRTKEFLDTQNDWNEFSALYTLIDKLPGNSHLHLANSLSVRYVNFIGLNKPHTIWANRGTSGIDGSSSAAMGHAIHNSRNYPLFSNR